MNTLLKQLDKHFVTLRDKIAVRDDISQPGIESCGLAPVFDKTHHDNIPVLYVQTLEHDDAGVRALSTAMNNVFVRDNGISETAMPVQCVITDEIPYNDSGKVDVFRITTNTIRGKTYNVRPVYRDGVLTEVKLVHTDSGPSKKKSYIEAVINN